MPEPRPIRANSTMTMSILMVLIGIALVVRTLSAGGGPLAIGVILGVLFVAAGVGRFYIGRMTR
jgi:hypothetical protein